MNMNPSGLELFGYTLDKIKGINLKDLYADSREREKCRKLFDENGFVRNCEIRLKKKDGGILDCTLSAKLQDGTDGKVLLIVIHDITDLKILGGLLPICSYCKKIRDDQGYWSQVESYIGRHSRAIFSHSICPDCVKKHFPELDDQE